MPVRCLPRLLTRLLPIAVPALLTFVGCSSGGTSEPPRSVARDLLRSCDDLLPPTDPTLTPPTETRRVNPRPPRNAGSSGFACIRGTVALDGRLVNLKVLRTDNPTFVLTCLEVLQQWRYKPAHRDGHPVAADTFIVLSFSRR